MRGVTYVLGAIVLATAAGCASRGVVSGAAGGAGSGSSEYPSETFEVQTDYEAALRRAGEFYRVCFVGKEHPFGVGYVANPSVDLKGTLGATRLAQVDQPARTLMLIETEPSGPRSATVHVTVIGERQWDAAQIDAARQSIQSATPVCRVEP